MKRQGPFLNFRVSDELMVCIDDAAQKSGWDRSKQVRYMLETMFGMARQPYFPKPKAADNSHYSMPGE
jgi:hypothetical protein